MAEVVLFHHVQGLTPGVEAFAEALRGGGHVVHVPDLFEGRVFDSLEDGMAHVGGLGQGEVTRRATRAAEQLPAAVVFAGMSLGVVPAQQLAQTREGAAGALLLHACLPVEDGGWPAGVPVQVHGMDADPFFADEGDLDAARALVAATEGAELFVYEGDAHLFADSSLPSYDEGAAALLTQRVLTFLERAGG